MTVRPTSSGQTPRPGIDRTGQPAPAAPATPRANENVASASRVRRDDVRISDQARELQQLDAGRGPAGELSADRLKEVLGRVAGGYYDQPHVIGEVVRRLAQDL